MLKDSFIDLPNILVIDDQFGRCDLGFEFKSSVEEEIYSAYKADRKNLCSNYGLITKNDSDTNVNIDAVAQATFCPGQIWDAEKKRIENNVQLVIEAVRKGWPFADGTRWALVLLDLAFVYGELDIFGDPQERTLFGLDVILPALKKEFGDDLPIVVLSSTSKEQNNPAIRRAGALDFIQRIPGAGAPIDECQKRLREVLFYHGLLQDEYQTIVGRTSSILKVLRQARRVAVAGKTILMYGETGTGKNQLASYIHRVSDRKNGPFEIFNASHRSVQLQEDELFGHWKGAFTGAEKDVPGLWERCDGGIVFIDEVADIGHEVQQKLMAPIETGVVKRMGYSPSGEKLERKVNVVTILATNRDPDLLRHKGLFKNDFLNRINANVILLPPLRQRKKDIPLLIDSLRNSIAPSWSGNIYASAINKLMNYDWNEGNIRELRNVLQAAITNNPGQDITEKDFGFSVSFPEDEVEESTLADLEQWKALFKALQVPPEELTRRECELYQSSLREAFTDLLAHLLSWSIRLNGDVTNAARFLSGCSAKEMDASAARQFLRRYLNLDRRGKRIINKFKSCPEAEQEIIKKLMD